MVMSGIRGLLRRTNARGSADISYIIFGSRTISLRHK